MLNVIVIIADALRARNTSCYGYSRRTTPFLERLAAESTLFKHAYTTSTWTIPTHASMLSGLYQRQHGLDNHRGDRRFNRDIVPLPELLRKHGYSTVAFSQNPFFSPDYGFDYFDEHYHRETIQVNPRAKNHAAPLRHLFQRYWAKQKGLGSFFRDVQDWIRARGQDEPFFLVANVVPVHSPWAPAPRLLLGQLKGNTRYVLKSEFSAPNPWRFNSGLRRVTAMHRQMWSALYDAATMHLDRALERFVAELKRGGKWENTVLVITADHGEMLGEHQDILGHTLTLHDNIMQVPLLVRHPDYPPGVQVEGVVQTLDMFASVVDWAEVDRQDVPSYQLYRPSLSEAVKEPEKEGGFAFAEEDYSGSHDVIAGLLRVNPMMDPQRFPRKQIAVHGGNYKYIWYDDRPPVFYDIEEDPNESRNVIECPAFDSTCREYVEALAEWQNDLPLFSPRILGEPVEVEAETRERLKALGYIE